MRVLASRLATRHVRLTRPKTTKLPDRKIGEKPPDSINDGVQWLVGVAEQKLARKGYEAAATEFSEADTDASGRIDKEELRVALIRAGRPASDEDVDAEFAKLDKNKDGKISPSEFLFKGGAKGGLMPSSGAKADKRGKEIVTHGEGREGTPKALKSTTSNETPPPTCKLTTYQRSGLGDDTCNCFRVVVSRDHCRDVTVAVRRARRAAYLLRFHGICVANAYLATQPRDLQQLVEEYSGGLHDQRGTRVFYQVPERGERGRVWQAYPGDRNPLRMSRSRL
ncbi:hypothetical protein EMIHUDRAFT_245289 [Emiliania huxleyi CCMP1516]|uniref:EF-hand domain-containing protein n=2 Tax=Emiliania huxleyi TaxID=2903 RepID=A0A0D3IY24_EMIH1|nr:hypothetical protein EMIHUDRAFT_245289 [Emiliania huxleyi CCMP1516]EOD16159.1 hypothetical protein EMIHUDRAFT_245289 [Emiliania huxleyi CCMP1516]|eukprot:XP_005768588.1 hypothetical protein EMIHUDRAFT_245289 [Emiliania huxleyi CCMP1516]